MESQKQIVRQSTQSAESGRVLAFCRVRPLNRGELQAGGSMAIEFPEDDNRVVSHIYQAKSSQRAPSKTDFVWKNPYDVRPRHQQR